MKFNLQWVSVPLFLHSVYSLVTGLYGWLIASSSNLTSYVENGPLIGWYNLQVGLQNSFVSLVLGLLTLFALRNCSISLGFQGK